MDFAARLETWLKPRRSTGLVAVDLFAGCGGLALGFEAAGIRTIGYEKDADACRSYRSNLRSECHEGWLTPQTPLPRCDILIGGPPCQPFSVGGLQLGLHDSRDGFPVFIAAVQKLRPELFLFENVRGMLYSNKAYFEEIIARLSGLGYQVSFKLLNAVDFGVPQKRERLIVVGHSCAFQFPEATGEIVTAGEALRELALLAPPESKFLTESMRRKDLNDALLAGLVVASAGKPGASVNDPTRGYALEPGLAELMRKFGQRGWQARAAAYMAERQSLAEKLRAQNATNVVAVDLPNGTRLALSEGPHNLLQKAIIEQFLPRFVPGAQVVYLGDTAQKSLYVSTGLAKPLGLDLDPSKKIPDVIAWARSKNWLFLIEAVHSFGPISNERRLSLAEFAKDSGAGLVFVTAFLDLKAFRKCAADIGWDTEAWIASEPDHMIHWNGDRFLGPRSE